ncbi:MAG: hypothetical protein KGZ42_12490 [Melioribacter sp.]|nr:hypothetical protein [Melioribacter sp.]
MIKKKLLQFVLISFLALNISSCMPGSVAMNEKSPAGFFMGVWHGWIAPVSLVVGLLNPSIKIYEKENTGWWYDLGFYVAIISGFGGISLSRKRKK